MLGTQPTLGLFDIDLRRVGEGAGCNNIMRCVVGNCLPAEAMSGMWIYG